MKQKISKIKCPECGEITKIIIGGQYDGFVNYACSHAIAFMLKEAMKIENAKNERMAGG